MGLVRALRLTLLLVVALGLGHHHVCLAVPEDLRPCVLPGSSVASCFKHWPQVFDENSAFCHLRLCEAIASGALRDANPDECRIDAGPKYLLLHTEVLPQLETRCKRLTPGRGTTTGPATPPPPPTTAAPTATSALEPVSSSLPPASSTLSPPTGPSASPRSPRPPKPRKPRPTSAQGSATHDPEPEDQEQEEATSGSLVSGGENRGSKGTAAASNVPPVPTVATAMIASDNDKSHDGSVSMTSGDATKKEDVQQIQGNLGGRNKPPPAQQVGASAGDGGPTSPTWIAVVIVILVAIVGLAGFLVWRQRRRRAAINGGGGGVAAAAVDGDEGLDDHGFDYELGEMELVTTHKPIIDDGVAVEFATPDEWSRSLALLPPSTAEALAGLGEWFLRPEDLEDVEVLGHGRHSVAYLVRYRGARRLVARRLISDHMVGDRLASFVEEIRLNVRLDHPHILPLVGLTWSNVSTIQALFAYMPEGDLRSYLNKTSRELRGVWTRQKLQIAIDIVEGLVYLHSLETPVIHRDLKSRNVLLSAERRAMLSDFGISQVMTTKIGMSRWLAPEVISGAGGYTTKCDIYSVGVILAELDTHEIPFSRCVDTRGKPISDITLLQRISRGSIELDTLETSPADLRALIDACIQFQPDDRPTAVEVAFRLKKMMRDEQLVVDGCDPVF